MEQTEEQKPKKKILGIVITVVAFVIAYFAGQQLFNKTPSFDKVLMQTASEINKTCPISIDQYTRLDNTVALPGNIFQYNYTMVTLDKSEVNADTLKAKLEPGIVNNIKTNPDLKIFRDNKTTMNYSYKDKNGVFVLTISVTPDKYN